MTQEEFDKAPLLDQILYDETGMLIENHPSIAKAMEEYHQAKLKLLGIGGVSQQRELLDLLTEIANSDTLYSNTRHRIIARKLLKSNCG